MHIMQYGYLKPGELKSEALIMSWRSVDEMDFSIALFSGEMSFESLSNIFTFPETRKVSSKFTER